ncbi:MAG: HesA/MoeB/ThiF family protein [Legionella sp.]|nr:HesA/MoeB/ThiF family protein [Legionella sp.]
MSNVLSTEEIKRYQRQMLLGKVGIEGQLRLKQSRVLCIGAGGLGSPVLLYLAAAGIGTLGIVDMDEVDITNLQRQVLFTESDVGVRKTTAAKDRLTQLNKNIDIIIYDEPFNELNAGKIIPSFDLIIDATDNFSAKYLINDSCVKYGKPYIYGSILGFEGRVSVLSAKHGPCYRCVYPEPPKGYIPNCAEFGIIGALPGIMGCIQAMEAIKWILGEWSAKRADELGQSSFQPLLGRLWILDVLTMQTLHYQIKKNPECPVCSKDLKDIKIEDKPMHCASKSTPAVPTVTLEESKIHINDENTLFLDVREISEWNAGFIDNAQHYPLSALLSGEGINVLDPQKKYIVYCQHGKRSQIATAYLMEMGFSNVVTLEKGFSTWDGEINFPE